MNFTFRKMKELNKMKTSILVLFLCSTLQVNSQARVETSSVYIYFENNQFDISEKDKNKIFTLAKQLTVETKSTFSLEIIGYTDSIGTKASNKVLSNKRAMCVYNELLRHSNSPEGIEQTIKVDVFPSVCNIEDETYIEKSIVKINVHGDGVYEKKPQEVSTINSDLFRKVEIIITEGIPNWEWGVLYNNHIPSHNSTLYFSNGTRLILGTASLKIGGISRTDVKYNLDTFDIQTTFEKTREADLFKELMEYNDSLFIVLGKVHISSFPIQSFIKDCQAIGGIVDPVKLRIPISDFSDSAPFLFTDKRIKFTEVVDSNITYLECDMSNYRIVSTMEGYRDVKLNSNGKEAYQTRREQFNYDVNIDVLRDTIFLVKAIKKKDSRDITIRMRGKNILPTYIKYQYADELFEIHFERIKNYFIFFKQYEATTHIYDQEKAIKVLITHPKNKNRVKRKSLRSLKTDDEFYLIRNRRL